MMRAHFSVGTIFNSEKRLSTTAGTFQCRECRWGPVEHRRVRITIINTCETPDSTAWTADPQEIRDSRDGCLPIHELHTPPTPPLSGISSTFSLGSGIEYEKLSSFGLGLGPAYRVKTPSTTAVCLGYVFYPAHSCHEGTISFHSLVRDVGLRCHSELLKSN